MIVGNTNGLSIYSGYSDNDESYRFRYYSPGLTFGDPSKLKILKKLRPTIVGANSATVFLYWSYDFSTSFRSQAYTIGNQEPDLYNIAEFNIGEYTGGDLVSRRAVNTTGDGSVITIGLESDINGFALSLQEINVLALIGKTL